MTPPTSLLFVVHPGSACGSADFHLGEATADRLRQKMADFVAQWEGGVVVIDGGLSDELDGSRSAWRQWGTTLKKALARAHQHQHMALRIEGDDDSDFNQMDATHHVVRHHHLDPTVTHITLTGAWVQNDDGVQGGCVHSVREVLEALGFSPDIAHPMDLDHTPENEISASAETAAVVSKTFARTRRVARRD